MQKAFVTTEKATDLGDGVVDVVVSTESVDRDGEVLSIKGLDTKNFQSNPVVLLHHDYHDFPIGKAVKLTKTKDGQLTARVQFAIDEYDKAHTAYKLAKGGYFSGVSIGFIPKEMQDNVFTKSEMLEFSFVTVPANPEALMQAKSKGIITQKEYEDLLDRKENPISKEILLGVEMLAAATKALQKDITEIKRLDHAGASRQKRVVRLLKVRSKTQLVQTLSQEVNNEIARSGAVTPKRKLKVKLSKKG